MQMPHPALTMSMPGLATMPMHTAPIMNNSRHQSTGSDDEVQGNKFLQKQS